MRKGLAISASLVVLLGFTSYVHAQTPISSAPPLRDGSHDMDFSFGTWRTDVSIVKDPFGRPSEVVRMSGSKRVTPIWGGKAALEEIEADGPSSHWEAGNLMLYNPAAHQWSQNYFDSATGRLEGPPGIGEYRDGRLEFYWQAKVGDRTLLERGVWTLIDANSHTYEVARSVDGGRSWHTSFTARLTRVK